MRVRLSGKKSVLIHLAREGARNPYLTLRSSLRLVLRGLDYLSENPDVLLLPSLLQEGGDHGHERNALLLIGRAERISVALLIKQSADNGLIVETISRDLPAEAPTSPDRLHLQSTVERLEERYGLIDTAIFLSGPAVQRIKTTILSKQGEDPFLIAAEGFLDEVHRGGIVIWPQISTLEAISQIEPKELLNRFAGRFGLYPEYRRDLRKATRGLVTLVRGLPRLIRGRPSFPPLP